jgi:hypothetical protein
MQDNKYTEEDYMEAVAFALNYPPKLPSYHYDIHKDLYIVNACDGWGWHQAELQGQFVRNCLKWKGVKKWIREE